MLTVCICVVCGEEFEARTMFATMCSARCRMRKRRATDAGKAYVKEYNKRYKRSGVSKVCCFCGEVFVTARLNQVLCSGCSKSKGAFIVQSKYRSHHVEAHKL